VLEGLSNRLYLEGETPVRGSALERFVADRLPLLQLNDERQLLEPEMQQMLGNYLATGLQLASWQLAHHEFARGLDTLRRVEAQIPPSRLGRLALSFRSTIASMRRTVAEEQRRLGAGTGGAVPRESGD
jgi:hypothetical protein